MDEGAVAESGPRPRAERTAATRARIERAALELFVARGIAETSIREIAAAAQVSQGAMYNHYESKEQLAAALYAGAWNEIGEEMRNRARSFEDLPAKMLSMIEFVFRRFEEDWMLVAFVFASGHRQSPPAQSEERDSPYAVFRLLIADGMRRNEIPAGLIDLKTAMVVGALTQIMDSRILMRLKEPLGDLTEATAALCVNMLSG